MSDQESNEFLETLRVMYDFFGKVIESLREQGCGVEDLMKLADPKHKVLLNYTMMVIAGTARVEPLSPQEILETSTNQVILEKALQLLPKNDPPLIRIATSYPEIEIREKAIDRITNEELLFRIVQTGFNGFPDRAAVRAVGKISNFEKLITIMTTHGCLPVRNEALERIQELHLFDKQNNPILEIVQRLAQITIELTIEENDDRIYTIRDIINAICNITYILHQTTVTKIVDRSEYINQIIQKDIKRYTRL